MLNERNQTAIQMPKRLMKRKPQPTFKLKEPRRAVLLVSRKLTSSQLQLLAEEVTAVVAADVEVVAVVTVVQVTDHETTKPRKPLLNSIWNQISQLLAKKSSYHLKYFLGLI